MFDQCAQAANHGGLARRHAGGNHGSVPNNWTRSGTVDSLELTFSEGPQELAALPA